LSLFDKEEEVSFKVSFEGKCNQRWQPLFEDLVADDWFVPSVFKETE